MESVVGLTVWVKLKDGVVVYGVVETLTPGSHLTLGNVFFPGSNQRFPHWDVQVTAIEDLQVMPQNGPPPNGPAPPPPPPSTHPSHQHQLQHQHQQHALPLRQPSSTNMHQPHTQQYHSPHQAPPPHQPHQPHQPPAVELPAFRHVSAMEVPPTAPTPPPRKPSAFVDPAIVSYGNSSPTPNKSTPQSGPPLETPIKSMLARAAQNLPSSPGSPFIGDMTKANVAQKLAAASKQSSATPPASKPNPPAPTVEAFESNTQDVTQADGSAKKKVRRGQKSKKQVPAAIETADPPAVMNSEVSRNGNDMNGSVKRGKGWRSTPLLQPSPQTSSPLDKANTKKSRGKTERNEFAQGDTTDIQDMADFDFETELKKFDKKTVWDEFRQGDTTADEDLLVSHNRARPGTNGGKNLHPTENVLSPKLEAKYNSHGLDSSTSDADTELNLNMANGRSSSKHSVTRKVFPKAKPTRQGSGQHIGLGMDSRTHGLAASVSSDRARNRSTASLVSRAKKATSVAASSPRPDRATSPHSAMPTGRVADSLTSSATREPYFGIRPHLTACPTLLPRALAALEAATVSTFGLAHEAITESAARGIAEAALHLSEEAGIRRPSRTNTLRGSMSMTSSAVLESNGSPTLTEQPTVVVLAGNHDIGARALAAARHLLGRNVKIIIAESQFESAETQDLQVKAQGTILRRMARGGASLRRGQWKKASGYIKALPSPPSVIIDALLAGATYESLLTPDSEYSSKVQAETREMIDWANRSRAPVLSVGCPSGVSGIDGLATTVEGEPLAVRPARVLALGAPFTGLLRATEAGEKWEVGVIDIGINIALKSEEAVAFGNQGWSVDLGFVGGEV